MDIKGKIIVALPEQSGTSRAGNVWKKREYVLETIETYPKKVAFHFFGERADQYPLNVGDVVTLSFDIESREYQGRWYTDIRGYKAEKDAAGTAAPAPAASAGAFPGDFPPPPAPAPGSLSGGAAEDLPF